VMRCRAQEQGLAFSLEYHSPIPETILTDAVRLRQVIYNLVGNALKFTPQGSVRLVVSFVAAWKNAMPALRIDVIDTGIGIRPEVLPTLFQPFNQGDIARVRKYGGTGLGLAISRHLAELLGGEVSATSTPGQGSTFTLIVPTGELRNARMLAAPGEVAWQTGAPTGSEPGKELAGIRILLAEDGPDNREMIRLMLRQSGASVETVENGRQAVERAMEQPFDVILMDTNMPEMDGDEAVRLLRGNGYHRPIIALTANAMPSDVQKSLAAGCDAHLTKPIVRQQLVSTIVQYAGKPRDGQAAPPSAAGPTTWDEERLRSQFADDPAMAEILDNFLTSLESQLGTMQELWAKGQEEELRRQAHRLKGSGGSYGYPALTEAAAALEEAIKRGDAQAKSAALEGLLALGWAILSHGQPVGD